MGAVHTCGLTPVLARAQVRAYTPQQAIMLQAQQEVKGQMAQANGNAEVHANLAHVLNCISRGVRAWVGA